MSGEWIGGILDGRYVMEAVLGRGGMGVVLRARHQFTGAIVAVKLLHPHVAVRPNYGARFLDEARAPARINHPAIVSVTDAGFSERGECYLVMELLDGETLGARLDRGPLPFEEARRIALEVLDALGAAHAAGLVHRDLKPDNVFLCAPSWRCKILDFGIAKVVNELAAGHTATGSVMGSVTYMSPEQLRDTKNVDGRTDLWAMGAIIQQMLTGELPYTATTFGEMLLQQHDQPPRPLPPAVAGATPGIAEVLRRALAIQLAERFASAADMAAALRALPAGPQTSGAYAPAATGGAYAPAASAVWSGPTALSGQPTVQSMPQPYPQLQGPAPLAPTYVEAQIVPAARSSTALWLLIGGIVFLGVLIVSAVGAALWLRQPSPKPSASKPDKPVVDQDCPSICARAQNKCGFPDDGNCENGCRVSATFAGCAGRAGGCDELAVCGLIAYCNGGAPSGSATCGETAGCEAECNARGMGDVQCHCKCIQRMKADHALALSINNLCATARCPKECAPNSTWTACSQCFAVRCERENKACRSSR